VVSPRVPHDPVAGEMLTDRGPRIQAAIGPVHENHRRPVTRHFQNQLGVVRRSQF
jgi:hypothetical protein